MRKCVDSMAEGRGKVHKEKAAVSRRQEAMWLNQVKRQGNKKKKVLVVEGYIYRTRIVDMSWLSEVKHYVAQKVEVKTKNIVYPEVLLWLKLYILRHL